MIDPNGPDNDATQNASCRNIAAFIKPAQALAGVVRQCKERYVKALRASAEYKVRAAAVLRPSPHDEALHWLILGGVAAVLILDLLVVGAPAAHFIRRSFSYVPVLTEILAVTARIVIPVLFLTAELLLGSLVVRFGRNSPHRNRPLQLVAAIAGIGIAATVTTMALVLDLAGQASSGPEAEGLSFHSILYGALAALVFGLHLLALFIGRAGVSAKEYFNAKWRMRRLQRAEEKAKRPYEQHDAAFVDLVTSYLQAVQTHYAAFGEKVPYGPFTETTQALLHEHFPHIFPPVAPKKPATLPTPTQKSPSSTWKEENDDVIDAEVIPAN